mgnify:CR=1 FL=1
MKIAIIDDQEEIRYSVAKILQRHKHTTLQFDGGESDLCHVLQNQKVDLLIVDVMLGDKLTGIDLLKSFKQKDIHFSIILMTAYTTPSNMIEASKLGIKDILQKPFDEAQLMALVEKHTHLSKDKDDTIIIRHTKEEFVGSYETMKEIYHKIGIAANNNLAVLIYGQTGTGKELIANLIHTNSKHVEYPFIAVNCASIPKELFESQLFGHEKGSFTSADKQHIGYAEQTAKGTLFLDEIGELDSDLQGKLLRFLETKTFRRVGGSKELFFEGRIISATNVDLKAKSTQGLFREDLYFRLSMLSITMPTLKERSQDIPILSEHFIAKANKELKTSIRAISKEALSQLERHQWRGNIRELRNVIYSACLNAHDDIIQREDVLFYDFVQEDTFEELFTKQCREYLLKNGVDKIKELETLVEKNFLKVSISLCPNISQLASLLTLSRNTLKKQLKEFHLYHDK